MLLQPYLGPDWNENLVALHYNMPRENAMQVLLGEKVEKAMTEGKPELLNEPAYRPGMEYVAEDILEDRLPNWCANEPYMIGRAANALSAPRISATIPGQKAYTRLLTEIQKIPSWPQLDIASGTGISLLLSRANDSGVSKNLILALTASSPVYEKTISEESSVPQWITGVMKIIDGLISLSQEALISEHFRLCKTPQDYLIILSNISTDYSKKHLWRYLRPGCTPNEVISYLNSTATSGTFTAAHESAIELMLNIDEQWPWEEFKGLNSRLQQNQQPLKPEEIARSLRILLRLRDTPSGNEQLLSLIKSGWFFHNCQSVQVGNIPDAMAPAVLVALLYDPEGTIGVPPNTTAVAGRNTYNSWVINPDQRKPLMDEVANLASTLKCIDELLTKRRAESIARPTFDTVLRTLAQSPKCFELFAPNTIIKHYLTIKSATDAESINQLLKSSVEQSTLEDDLVKSEFTIENSGLYRQTLHLRRTPRLLQKTVEGLKAFSKENWSQALEKPSDLIPLVADLIKWEVALGISLSLRDALGELGSKTFTEEIPDHIQPDSCHTLLSALTAEQQALFKKELRDKIIFATASSAKLIVLFPDALSDCEILVGKADDLVREGLKKMLERGDASEYEWMKNILQTCPKLLEQCPPGTKQDFKERVEKFDLTNLSDDCKTFLNEIRRICGVPVDQDKPTASTSVPA
jgi:hypothetical protein